MFLLLSACTWLGISEPEPPEPTVVYLVRHAEKALDAGDDPPLTPAGEARAKALAERLADVELRSVHSTDTLRTRSTAAPTARAHQLPLELYDARDPSALIETLKQHPGAHLVVGHSNTVPDLVSRLGGDGGPPIDEKREYDRLMRVELSEGGQATAAQLRYGDPPPSVTEER